MIGWFDEAGSAAFVGAFGGLLLGLAARLGRFCTLGAIEDALYGGSLFRARMWGVALGGSIVLTFAAELAGLVDLSDTFNLASSWSPVAVVAGGLLFGYGMAMAGNCGFGALARAGGGDLRSLVIVIVMGLSAYAVLSGPFASLRVAIFPPSIPLQPQGLAHGIAAFTGIPPVVSGFAIGTAILVAALADRAFLRRWRDVAWGLTAFSVLAYSAPLASAAIVLGAAIGLRQLITGFAVP